MSREEEFHDSFSHVMVSTIRCKWEKVCVLFGMGLVATSLLKLVVRMLPESVSCSKEMCQDVQGVFGWLVDGNYIGPNLYKGSDSDFLETGIEKTSIYIYIRNNVSFGHIYT